ncbi:DUF3108 domain-containing protein [Devosia sp. Root635]|uniref:DUF3108 domain-containing protein n=1 Tax=Devosia sp. Root635 TaxID=1736575 RepID=UPI0006F28F3E|nr:DUF3108 domain-containing protein [Devosia sp. Root635]KRA44637.1 hypothetical protein ASD80_05680 [Devosia sp. Root635]
MIQLRLVPLAALAVFLSHPAGAAEVDARASYILTLGGINIAAMKVDLEDNGSRYTLDLSANVAGLGTLVASGTAKATSTGRSSGSSLLAEEFDLETRANGETFTVDVSFAGHDVSAFKVTPPIVDNYDRVPLERRHLTGVGDFLSAFVLKGNGLDRSLCQRQAKIFTGVERFNIAMSYAGDDEATSPRTGYQGPVVLCTVDYDPVSGHFTSSDITNYLADSDRIVIWYAPLGETGYFIPYRVLLGTDMGDLSMVLTEMRF